MFSISIAILSTRHVDDIPKKELENKNSDRVIYTTDGTR